MRDRKGRGAAVNAELDDAVLSCFQRASSEGRFEVAEHLLLALEQLSKEDLGAADPERHRPLAEAYRGIVDLRSPAAASREAKAGGS